MAAVVADFLAVLQQAPDAGSKVLEAQKHGWLSLSFEERHVLDQHIKRQEECKG